MRLPRRSVTWALALLAVAACGVASAQQAPAAPALPDAYAVEGGRMSFFNTPNRRHTIIHAGDATVLGKVTVKLEKPADVLVQFSSGIATVSAEGCPCSVRVALQVDDEEPVVIKRINLGVVPAVAGQPFRPDRQSADGSFVFSLPAGAHRISLVAMRVEGDSKVLHAFYQNIQAIRFERTAPPVATMPAQGHLF